MDMTADLGLAVACGSPDPATLANVLAAAEAACKSLEACRAALPAEGGQEAGGGEGEAAGRRGVITLKNGQPPPWLGPGAKRVPVVGEGDGA
jgi:hypothetical protein